MTKYDDCVSRQEVLNLIFPHCSDDGRVDVFMELLDDVENLDTVEPERPKGKWVDGICNKCGYDGGVEAYSGKANYCSICGADMRGE